MLVLELKVLLNEIDLVIFRKYLAALVIPGNGLIEHPRLSEPDIALAAAAILI